ncbi:MFS transporter [Streptomyces sp. NBC_00638]|uniref:MFS transporter n=1 Tax=Streptomyces sp. NBC_00638 TaxID=2975794 RepID=UPI002254CEEF|nr:MFS transporter [Streptomyces sp. NBC_00638]MCX5008906.1 MFS transporter [Streptomyces sp. NBC_00638]
MPLIGHHVKFLIPGVLRDEPQFARLFIGQALSVLGDRVSFIAVPFAVLSIGGSASDVGLVAASGLIPMLLFALVGGVWADRFKRHRVMLVSDVVRFAVQGLIAVLLITGAAEIPHLVLLMLVFGTADAFFMPASTGLLPLVVGPDRLREANALRGFTQSSTLVLGPALAGGVVALLGPGGALALDALTFAASAAFLARLKPRSTAPETAEPTAGGTFLKEVRAGWRQVRSRTWVWSCMAAMAVYHVVVLPSVFVLGPVMAQQEWGGAASWSTVTAGFGIGSIVGDVCAYRLKVPRPMALAAAGLAVGSCQAIIIGSGTSVAMITVLEGITGVGVSLFFVLWETALQTHVPEAALSRVSSYDYLLSAGLMPLGLALAGPVSGSLGVRPTLYAMTVVAVPAALALLCVPAVRRLPAQASGTANGSGGIHAAAEAGLP